jgi:hypothetical protein
MPTDNEIDYRRFTRAELLDAKVNIDARQYPQNYQRLIAEIAFRESGGRPEATPQKPERISRINATLTAAVQRLSTNFAFRELV